MRGAEFVTRKITLSLARIKCGEQDRLTLGNMDARRDWGFAGDYVDGMWRMLQQPAGDSFVLATGETHTVQDFVDHVAGALDIEIVWDGYGVDKLGIDRKTGRPIVTVDPQYFRPSEVNLLRGNCEKAGRILGWQPKVTFAQLAAMMAEADYDRVRNGTLKV